MAGSIRAAVDKVIEERALPGVAQAFEIDHGDTFDRFVVPYAPIAGQLADALTTRAALNRGFVEGNPFMRGAVRNMPLFFALKVGIGAATTLAVKRLQDGGRTNAARVVSFVGTLAGAGPALSNINLIRR